MKKILSVLIVIFILSSAVFSASQAEDARKAVEKISPSIVTVETVIEVTYEWENGETETNESKLNSIGTIIDKSGLVVLGLSNVVAPEGESIKSSSTKSMKVRMPDGKQIDCDIAVKDNDYNIAIIKMRETPESIVVAEFSENTGLELFDELLIPTRLPSYANYILTASLESVSCIVAKPKTMYIIDALNLADAAGVAAFAMDGKLFGVSVNQKYDASTEFGLVGVIPIKELGAILKQAKQ